MKISRKMLFLFLPVLWAISVHAAQTGKVVSEQAVIREFPNAGSKKLMELRRGETLAVSNLPTEGFYKVRIAKDEYGWISGNDILVDATPVQVVVSGETVAAAPEEFLGDKTRLLLGFGVHDLSYGGLTDNFIGASDLNLGSHYSLELQRKIFYLLYWSVRAEIMNAESGDQNISSTTVQRMKSHSVPIQLGILFHPIHARQFRIGIGLYGGLSFFTSTEIEQTTSSVTNSVKYSTIDPLGTAVIQGTYGLGKSLGLFGEIAYRYQVTGALDSTTVLDSNNPIPSFKLDYSGIFLKGGLELRF
jgi:hypothetical protein